MMNYEINSNYKVIILSNHKLEFKHGIYSSESFVIEDIEEDANLKDYLELVNSFGTPDTGAEQFEEFRERLFDKGYLKRIEKERVVNVHKPETGEDLDLEDGHHIIYVKDTSLLDIINGQMYENDLSWTGVWEGPRSVFTASFHPDETGCFNCLKKRIESNNGYEDFKTDSPSKIAEHIIKTEKEKFEKYEVSETSGNLHIINKKNYVSSKEKLLRLPRCDICGQKNPSQTFIQTEDIV